MLLISRLWITIEFELSSPSWSAPAPGPLSHGSTSWWMISLEVQKKRGMSQDFRGNHRKTRVKPIRNNKGHPTIWWIINDHRLSSFPYTAKLIKIGNFEVCPIHGQQPHRTSRSFLFGSQPWKRNNLEISRAQKEPLKHNVVSYGFWSPNTSLGFQKPPHYVSNLWRLEDWCAKLGFHNPSWIPFSNLQRVRRVHLSNLLQHWGTIGRLENPAGLQQTHLPVPQGTLGEWLVNRWVNNEQQVVYERWCISHVLMLESMCQMYVVIVWWFGTFDSGIFSHLAKDLLRVGFA